MPSTVSLIQRLKTDYPTLLFVRGNDFSWSPSDQTVYYKDEAGSDAFLLHELSHGLLRHSEYNRDIELIAMERAAWDKASELASVYNQKIDESLIEITLDSYRDWLHARSTCPNCSATGLQTKKQIYTCPACNHSWRVNEARVCALRRFSI
jgi:hypothetical protein